MNRPITIESTIHFDHGGRGRSKRVLNGAPPTPEAPKLVRIPRIARLMALAIRFDGLIRTGVVADYAELARLGHVTSARITQIMNLLMLAPDIQEAILFLSTIERGRDRIHIRNLQSIALTPDWRKQRQAWKKLLARSIEVERGESLRFQD